MLFRLAAGLVSALFLVPGVLTAPALDTRAYSVKINGDVTRPWPNNQVIIAYEHDNTEVLLGEIVTEAMKLWEETGITIQTQVGWTERENVLRATVNHDGHMATTVGYRPGQEMTLKFDPNPSEKVGNGNLVVAMAHELGRLHHPPLLARPDQNLYWMGKAIRSACGMNTSAPMPTPSTSTSTARI
jgi:hypothetical protein